MPARNGPFPRIDVFFPLARVLACFSSHALATRWRAFENQVACESVKSTRCRQGDFKMSKKCMVKITVRFQSMQPVHDNKTDLHFAYTI